MKARNIIYLLATAALFLLALSCLGCSGLSKGITKVTDAITKPSAREVYAREFEDNNIVYNNWEAAYYSALSDSVEVALPYGEKGKFNPAMAVAYSYTIHLQEGEVLVAEVLKDSVNQRIFMDIFEQTTTGYTHKQSNEQVANTIVYEPGADATLKVIIQPEFDANTDFFIRINKRPLYTTFPVTGKGNAAIGSFWGMERDGGKRSHEGIDIFAKRGTPVVAVVKGSIGYTGERGLGGKQVWLRDGLFGASLYYAHLDSIKVTSGVSVNVGDTLGFVGNTGNAKTTVPHLHFGIYKGYGAVNPLPFVFATEKVMQNQFARSYKTAVLKVKSRANLRRGPSASSAVVGSLQANDTLTLLGQSKDWLHIQTSTGKKAFISKSLVKG